MTDSTYRERRMAKAERLRGWAGKRKVKAEAALSDARQRADAIPFGQPILTDHHSAPRDRRYRAGITRKFEQGFEHAGKARDMERRADGIEAAAEHAIYSDDPDAVERLTERIADLEAQRDRIKRYNASCRKAAKVGEVGDLSLLDDHQRQEILTLARVCAYQVRDGGGFPAYVTSNLGGQITRNRKRLASLASS
jgi:hypothetical protein